MRLREDKIFSVIALPYLFYFVLLYRALLCPALLSMVLYDLVACFVCVWDLWVRPSGLWECSFTYVFWFVRFMSVLFGAVVRSIGNITDRKMLGETNSVKTDRKMLEVTNPADSLPGTIRGDYCIDIGRNICHGSDSVETAKKEIALWFKQGELNNYCCANNSWVYE